MIEANFNPFPDMTTQRLRLRAVEPTDQQEIFSLRSDHRVNQYLDRDPAHTIQDAINFIDRIINGIEKNEIIYWGICLKENPRLIGTIGLFNISLKSSTAEVGYELHPFYQGKGIMFEAINTVLKFGFEEMKLNSIFAECSKNNKDSIRLLERLGFRLDGALTTEAPPRNDLEFVSYRLDAPSKKDS